MDHEAIREQADRLSNPVHGAGYLEGSNRKDPSPPSYSSSDRDSTLGGNRTSAGNEKRVTPDDPAPLSSALHIPTLLDESHPPGTSKSEVHPDDPAPLSSALHIPTLLDESEPSETSQSEVHPDNPAPLSSALHIPTLLNESKDKPVNR